MDGRTDKSLKTEGHMILSIDIFYFKTVIIGGPIEKIQISTIKQTILQTYCRQWAAVKKIIKLALTVISSI